MALSTCPKCDSHIFEVKIAEPKKSNYKLLFVQCISCGAVVGVMDAMNIGAVLAQQNEAIKRIAHSLNTSVDI